jgi:DNA-binding response OmpR family regulator
MEMQRRILIVEDDPDIAQLVAFNLRDAGNDVTVERTGEAGLSRAETESFDMAILDVMLPGMSGLDLCQRLRSESKYLPVLMLTARSSEIDRVLGLELGADDYLTKPFSVMELVARVKAIFRRLAAVTDETAQADVIRSSDISVDLGRHEVSVEGKPVALTAKEFELLSFLVRHPGRVFTRAQLLQQVWGYGHDGYEHTVNSHINRLRGKIEPDPANPRHILTVWSIGYKFRDHGARAS